MPTITTVNVNGIRAAVRKGMLGWLDTAAPDILCLQETRAADDELMSALAPAVADGWHLVSAEPSAKGRNGVAILSRTPPENVRIGIGDPEFDEAGRYIEAAYGEITVASLYLPSGEVQTPRQDEKERFMKSFAAYLDTSAEQTVRKHRHMVVCGDWNIAPAEVDIKSWKTNRKKSGFLPEEREWVANLLAPTSHWRDVVREQHPDVDGPYSWWSYRGKAFDNDAGWRIDYHLATTDLADRVVHAITERAEAYDQRWSDHAPVTVVYG